MDFSPELTSRAARIERDILGLNRHAASGQLESVARLLMRSEAISSSRIEGIAPNVDKVILAELAQVEEVRGLRKARKRLPVTLPFCVPSSRALPPNRQSPSSFLKSFKES